MVILGFIGFFWFWKGFIFDVVLYSIIIGFIASVLIVIPLALSYPQIKTRKFVLLFILAIQVLYFSFIEKRSLKKPYPAEIYLHAGDLFFDKNDKESEVFIINLKKL